VDYDEELFDDENFETNYESDDEESEYDDDDSNQYDEMDVNELADITNEPHRFNVPNANNQNNEPAIFQNEEEEIIFEEDESVEEVIEEDDEEEQDEDYDESDEEDISLEADEEEEPNPMLRRTERTRVPNPRYQHLQSSNERTEEYTIEVAHVIAMTMNHYMNSMVGMNDAETYSFIQTYSLNKGLKKFGAHGKYAAQKEMKQLQDRIVFEPILNSEMTSSERKRAMESLIFLTEKRDGTVKA
jgi:hypothetical protein